MFQILRTHLAKVDVVITRDQYKVFFNFRVEIWVQLRIVFSKQPTWVLLVSEVKIKMFYVIFQHWVQFALVE